MEYFPAPLEKLVEQFAKLPGVGYKSAQRLAFHVLSLPAEEAQAFADAITDAKRSVTLCPICQNLTAGGLCPICADAKRDDATICVVADPRDVIAIERSREYRGRYHVLHGVLSPMNHVGPDDLHIRSLLDRVAQGGITEVIMATNPDTEGEATAPVYRAAAEALRRKGHAAGLRHPRGRSSGIRRRRHADAGTGRAAGAVKRLACLLLACLTALSLTACGAPKAQEVSLFAMDTYMTLSAYGDSAEEALAAASREINRLESTLSRTIAASDVSRLNAGETVTVQKETRELLERALALSDETGGAFDMTVAPLVSLWGITSDAPHVPSPEEIDALLPLVGSEHVHMDGSIVSLDAGCAVDLGGIAKGYASQQVADILQAHGVTSAVVSLGGNVYVCGAKPDGSAWNVGIQDPTSSGYAATVALTDCFAVTSGGYQRYYVAEDGTVYQHIIDPRTGRPADSDLLSVTVVSDDGTAADAYSTALYVMGEQEAVSFWRAHGDFELILITADGRLLYTPELADTITAPEGCAYDFQPIIAQPAA